jgi:hypothetical protein
MTIGELYIAIGGQAFQDRLSMLYHGLQIAIATNRKLLVDHQKFAPIQLPSVVIHSASDHQGVALPGDYSFCCCDLTASNLKLVGASWPQALYIHPVIAPFLRSRFSYHAAYFLGNFLFGATDKPEQRCFNGGDYVVEAWRFDPGDDVVHTDAWERIVPACAPLKNSTLLTNEKQVNINSAAYNRVEFIDDNPESLTCAMRKMTSARAIVQTFGSRLGFWATALHGSKGAFVNAQERICVNMTNSQQGSIWHTWCPFGKNNWQYRVNWWFYVCGPNHYDARLYFNYLLW